MDLSKLKPYYVKNFDNIRHMVDLAAEEAGCRSRQKAGCRTLQKVFRKEAIPVRPFRPEAFRFPTETKRRRPWQANTKSQEVNTSC